MLQQVRQNSPSFNAALIAFIEAHRSEDAEKNRLCPPNPYTRSIDDWPGMSRRTWKVEQRWLREPDVAGWVAESRLNLLRGLPERAADPPVQAAVERFVTYVGPALYERWPSSISSAHRLRADRFADSSSAERVGFEPTRQFSPPTRFPIVHLKPLGHPSR